METIQFYDMFLNDSEAFLKSTPLVAKPFYLTSILFFSNVAGEKKINACEELQQMFIKCLLIKSNLIVMPICLDFSHLWEHRNKLSHTKFKGISQSRKPCTNSKQCATNNRAQINHAMYSGLSFYTPILLLCLRERDTHTTKNNTEIVVVWKQASQFLK